jgi:hypothetical protein
MMDISPRSARRVTTGSDRLPLTRTQVIREHFTTTAAAVSYSGRMDGPVHRTSRFREAAANDRQVTLACFSIDGKRGSVLDRNVELSLIVPGPTSAAAP